MLEFLKPADKMQADFRVQWVGGNAGKASTELAEYSPATSFFVQNISDIPDDELIEIINSLDHPSRYHTTGPRSVPKTELIQKLEIAVHGDLPVEKKPKTLF